MYWNQEVLRCSDSQAKQRTQPPPIRHPWLSGGLFEHRVQTLLFYLQNIKYFYVSNIFILSECGTSIYIQFTIRFASFSSIFLLNHSFYLVARCKSPAKLFIFLVLLVCLVYAKQALDDESDTNADRAENQCQLQTGHITHGYVQWNHKTYEKRNA